MLIIVVLAAAVGLSAAWAYTTRRRLRRAAAECDTANTSPLMPLVLPAVTHPLESRVPNIGERLVGAGPLLEIAVGRPRHRARGSACLRGASNRLAGLRRQGEGRKGRFWKFATPFGVAAVVSMLFITSASAQTPPFTLYGTGLAAGATVEASIGMASCGTATADARGNWALQIASNAPCSPVQGDVLGFRVNGQVATSAHTETYQAGGAPVDVANGVTLTIAVSGFDRPISDPGVNVAVWNGGSVDQLASAATASGAVSVTVFVKGRAVVLVPGAPSFVNAAFSSGFTSGVPAGTIVLVVLTALPASPSAAPPPTATVVRSYSAPPPMTIDTSKTYEAVIHLDSGDVHVQLVPQDAPGYVNNFVFLAQHHFFDGLTFYRVVPGFVAQAGDPTGTGYGDAGYSLPEEHNTIPFDAGVISMAKAGSHVSGSQFFITLAPAGNLNGSFTVFGRVTSGLNLLQALPARDPQQADQPEGAVIKSIDITEGHAG